MSIIKSSLKEIGSYVSEREPILNIFFTKSRKFFLKKLIVLNMFSMCLNKQANKQPVAAYQTSSKSTEKCVRKWKQKFLFSHTIMTVDEGQGNPNWHLSIQLTGIFQQTQCKRNRSVNVRMQPALTYFFKQISPLNIEQRDKLNMSFIKPKRLNSRPNSIPIDSTLWEIIGALVFAFARYWPCIKVRITYTSSKV